MAAAVTRKIKTGNFRAAVRISCSQDKPAEPIDHTLRALLAKHPAPPSDRRKPLDPANYPHFQPLRIESETVKKALRTFPPGSSGGPDGTDMSPQHLRDYLTDSELPMAITELINRTLAVTNSVRKQVRKVLYGPGKRPLA